MDPQNQQQYVYQNVVTYDAAGQPVPVQQMPVQPVTYMQPQQ